MKVLTKRKSELNQRGDFKKGRAKYGWHEYSRVQNPSLFEMKYKLVTPYKSFRNNFCLDDKFSIFSADVYGIGFPEDVNPFLIMGMLNSSLAEFAIKFNAKRIDYRYEYYEEALSAFPVAKGLIDNLKCTTAEVKSLADIRKKIAKASQKELAEILAGLAKFSMSNGESQEARSLIDDAISAIYSLSKEESTWLTDYVDQEIRDNISSDEDDVDDDVAA